MPSEQLLPRELLCDDDDFKVTLGVWSAAMLPTFIGDLQKLRIHLLAQAFFDLRLE